MEKNIRKLLHDQFTFVNSLSNDYKNQIVLYTDEGYKTLNEK